MLFTNEQCPFIFFARIYETYRIITVQRFTRFLLLCSFLFASTTANTAPNKAAMIIRFDHNVPVNYERSLQKMVKAAIHVKPETFFDIVSVVPHTTNASQNISSDNWAQGNTTTVIEQLKASGVHSDNIRVTYQPSNNSIRNEVHIFVR